MSALAALILAATAPQFASTADSPRRISVSRSAVRAVILRSARAEPETREGELRRRRHARRDGTLSIDFD